jgi:wobble nucleotide-excising tRNase
LAGNKNISKSVRLTDEVYAVIMAAPGNGFNEKFENIILEAKNGEMQRLKKIADLDKTIEDQQRKLYKLYDRYRYMDEFFRDFLHLRHDFETVRGDLDNAMKSTTQPEPEQIDD